MQRISSSSNKTDKEATEKSQQYSSISEKNSKQRGLKNQKSKISHIDSIAKLEDSNCADVFFRHLNKSTNIENNQLSDDNYQNSILEELDFNETQSSLQALLKHSNILKERNQQILRDINDERNNVVGGETSESPLSQKDEEDHILLENTSARSQLSLTISHQSSNDSDRSYSRSVVIRSQQDHHHHHHHHTTGLTNSKKLEQ